MGDQNRYPGPLQSLLSKRSSLATNPRRIVTRAIILICLFVILQTPAATQFDRNAAVILIGTETELTTSVAWGDWDNDGDLDLAVGNNGLNQVYRNDGPAGFDLAWQSTGDVAFTRSLAWGDWDGDGDLDLAVGNDSEANQIYQNEGGVLSLAWQSSGDEKRTFSLAWGDWDGDGDPDLAVGNDGLNQIYQNEGGDLSLAWQSGDQKRTFSLAWGDWDGDGDPDLAVGNDGLNQVYQNEGGDLSLAWQSGGDEKQTRSVAWGDWDNDGDLDLAVGNDEQVNQVYRNEGGDLSLAWQSGGDEKRTHSVAWGDWDNDGDLDLAVGNKGQVNQIYQYEGGLLKFDPLHGLGWESTGYAEETRSVAWDDWDGDGNLDLAAGNYHHQNQIYAVSRPVPPLFLAFGLPATETVEEEWPGHTWVYDPLTSRTFEAPFPESTVEVQVDWKWTGSHYGPDQLNETHQAILPNGEVVSCPDFGDKELDQDPQDNTGDEWIPCAAPVTFDWSSDLTIQVQFTGDDSSPGSHLFRVTVRWQPALAPPDCASVDLSLASGSKMPFEGTTVDVEVNATNATLYRLVRYEPDGPLSVIADPQAGNRFAGIHLYPNVTYQAQAGNDLGDWSSTSCTFRYEMLAVAPAGTATCNGGSVTNQNPFPIEVDYTVDGLTQFKGQVPANTTQAITYTFNDGADHSAQFTWAGDGQGGTIDLGSFGPCGAIAPAGTAACNGGSLTNPNLFPIQASYSVDGLIQFKGQISANTTQAINYALNDGANHSAQFTWAGNGEAGTVALGSFGPCGATIPGGTAGCSGGSVTNPNSFPIQVAYSVDGVLQFNGQVAAGSTQATNYGLNDGANHSAQFTWAGNGEGGTVNLGSFGPCGASAPIATAGCEGGSITNPNAFPIQVDYSVDGLTRFSGQIPANTTQAVNYTYNDGADHSAQFTWAGNGQGGTVDLGAFGPCSAATPNGATGCNGGSVSNPNPFAINVIYTVDGLEVFNGPVAANFTQPINYAFSDGATHTAQFTWSGNNQNGTVSLGSFGPCGAAIPAGTAGCGGGSVSNPNPFPIQVSYTVDGQNRFQGQVDANTTRQIAYTFNDGTNHSAQFTWSGNGENGLVDLGSFGPCGALAPGGTAGCSGGSVSNANSFPIQVSYTVDGQIEFQGQVPPGSTRTVDYSFNDGAGHSAEFTWSGNNEGGTIDLGSFGPCGAIDPGGAADCGGGSISNANSFPIQVSYTVDGQIEFQGQVPANTTQAVSFTFADGNIHTARFTWSGNGLGGSVDLGSFGPCSALTPSGAASCSGGSVTNPNIFAIQVRYTVDDRVVFDGQVPANTTTTIPYTFRDSGKHRAQFTWSGNGLSGTVDLGTFGPCARPTQQYQDFIGPVPFGNDTPPREPAKDYFDGPRSVMYNVEYITAEGQGEIVFRFNGRELSHIVSSLFNGGTFRQVESRDGRAVTTFAEGVTKLIGYRFEVERTRIFQEVSPGPTRWIHPLDQPFEHKPQFALKIYGPPGATDYLRYHDHQQAIRYGSDGSATVELAYSRPGLVALYQTAGITDAVRWTTVGALTFPITTAQTVSYNFSETGLYHYRIVDQAGQVAAQPETRPSLKFTAEPGATYYPQLAYPATSLFVALLDAMQFKPTPYWTMPLDPQAEHVFEFHLDYHRLNDPDLGNPHIRGDVVVDGLYLLNATTSVAQQYPYGRHDGALLGVTIVGIPDVSLVAFCGRPGVHEVVYWGGWENESYYLPDKGRIFAPNLYDEWTPDQHGDCIDAARRVNMLLAREGLRTDHTYRHHREASQGYQMTQRHIWSPYNLAGLRPPHVGQLLKPGTVLPYAEAPEDQLFWGWDLETGGLADGLGPAELGQHIDSLGAIEYVDQTGIHPPRK